MSQNGIACSYTIRTLNPDSTTSPETSKGFLAAGGTGSIAVTAPQGCAWTPTANDAFVGISGGSSGSGNGTVRYTVAPNPANAPARMGSATIQGLNCVIKEAARITQRYAANVTAGLPPTIRLEAMSELTGDIVVSTAGTAAPAGVIGDVVVTFNTTVTSRALSIDTSGQTIEAL